MDSGSYGYVPSILCGDVRALETFERLCDPLRLPSLLLPSLFFFFGGQIYRNGHRFF